jgi:TonB family protein
MFETSVIHARVAQRRFSLLSVSLAAHSLVVIAVIAASLSSMSFPKAPPHEYQVFFQQAAPPPPPAAPHQATPQPAQPHAATLPNVLPHAATTPATLTPARIPDTIPSVAPQSSSSEVTPATTEIGLSDGNGRGNGQSGGDSSSSDDTTSVPDTVFHPGADVKPAVVLYRVEPLYPRATLVARMAGTVVLKCVIDRNGNVRDAEVVTSSFAAFNQPALDALQRWRFAPRLAPRQGGRHLVRADDPVPAAVRQLRPRTDRQLII